MFFALKMVFKNKLLTVLFYILYVFQVIPNLKNWEEILYITEPESWSAAAMYQVYSFLNELKIELEVNCDLFRQLACFHRT